MARWFSRGSDISQGTKDEIAIIEAKAQADIARMQEKGFQDRSSAWTDHATQMLQNSANFWQERLSSSGNDYNDSNNYADTSGNNETASWVDWNW
jgi:hypothetical protein